MDWMLIITMIIEAIMECMENRNNRRGRSREQIEAGLLKPGALESIMLRQILRREQGLRGKKLRVACREGLEALRATPKAVIVSWCDEAEENLSESA